MLKTRDRHQRPEYQSKRICRCLMPGREGQVVVLVRVVDCGLEVNNDGIVACSSSQCGRYMQLLRDHGYEVNRNIVMVLPITTCDFGGNVDRQDGEYGVAVG
jgi:hypothetical protein